MTREELKRLSLEDFQAPNRVLCYGAGIMGHTLAESYQRVGLNVVGFIDKYKQGTVDTAFGALPIYSISAAVRNYGEELSVIITVNHARLFSEITSDLTAAGIPRERIYDWNSFNWMTVPSPKCCCEQLFQNTHMISGSLMKCCFWGDNRSFNAEILGGGVPFEESLESYVEKTRYYYARALKGEVPLYCAGCPHLTDQPLEDVLRFRSIHFAASVQCNAACVYCNGMEEASSSKFVCDADGYGAMFLTMLRWFEKQELLSPDTQIIFAGGEISISPRRRELLDFVLSHPSYEYHFLSNCAVYDENIARALAQGPGNVLMCDLDAGTPETYTLVKGYNYFESAVKNLKKYASHGNVVLKYIVIPGFNTSDEDYKGMVRVLQELGLDKLTLSREFFQLSDLFQERKVLFEVARFQKILKENGISTILFPNSFDERQVHMIGHLYRQLSKLPEGGQGSENAGSAMAGQEGHGA